MGTIYPNCIDSGAISLSVVSLTLDVPSSGFSDRLRIRRGQKCAWGTVAIQESLNLSPNIRTASDAGRKILKTSCTL